MCDEVKPQTQRLLSSLAVSLYSDMDLFVSSSYANFAVDLFKVSTSIVLTDNAVALTVASSFAVVFLFVFASAVKHSLFLSAENIC